MAFSDVSREPDDAVIARVGSERRQAEVEDLDTTW